MVVFAVHRRVHHSNANRYHQCKPKCYLHLMNHNISVLVFSAKPFEAPCTSTCLCVPKMCSIFGGHDYNAPGPDPKACSPRKSTINESPPSIDSHSAVIN